MSSLLLRGIARFGTRFAARTASTTTSAASSVTASAACRLAVQRSRPSLMPNLVRSARFLSSSSPEAASEGLTTPQLAIFASITAGYAAYILFDSGLGPKTTSDDKPSVEDADEASITASTITDIDDSAPAPVPTPAQNDVQANAPVDPDNNVTADTTEPAVPNGVATEGQDVSEPEDDAPAEDLSSNNSNDDVPALEVPAEEAQDDDNQPLAAPYVIIGGGTAAFFAIKGIMDKDENAKILVLTKEDALPYSRPPLSKELWFQQGEDDENFSYKDWGGHTRKIFHRPASFFCTPRELMSAEASAVALVTGAEVVDIDHRQKILDLKDGRVVLYEKLLIATGGEPKNLKVFEQKPEIADRVIVFRTLTDYQHLKKLSNEGNSFAVVGGGFLGSELAVALATNANNNGHGNVTQIFPESGNMAKILPEYLREWTTDKMRALGVNVIPNASVEDAAPSDNGVMLHLSGGSTVEVNYVLVAVGLEANTQLAHRAGLEVDPVKGGILVNAELEARRDVWVAGDAASFYDVSLGRRREEHHDHATVSGRLAGENMAGARRPYTHQSMFWSDLGPEVGYEAIGIIDASLPTVGVWAAATAKDTPKAAVEQGNIRAGVDENKPEDASSSSSSSPAEESAGVAVDAEDSSTPLEKAQSSQSGFGKGVVFYMRDQRVVGVLLWNVYNKIPVARRIIREGKQYSDESELTRLFKLHE